MMLVAGGAVLMIESQYGCFVIAVKGLVVGTQGDDNPCLPNTDTFSGRSHTNHHLW